MSLTHLLKVIALAGFALFLAEEFYSNFRIIRRLGPLIAPDTREIVARVAGRPISRSQLDRAVSEQLWLEGKVADSLTTGERDALRRTALDELIDHELLRVQVQAYKPEITVSDAEIDERLRRLVGRFESKGVLETSMKAQGIADEHDLKARLSARIRQEKFVAAQVGGSSRVSVDEARQWFDKNQQSIALPERVEARHIFIPALDHPPEESKRKLDAARAALIEKKKDFATLAKEISEDPATKDHGGSLGWMTRDRLPADFALPLFLLESNQPTLIRTRLGWHLVEVTAHKAGELRTFEQAQPEIISALVALKRRTATAEFRKLLRKSESAKIEIFDDVAAFSGRNALRD